MTPTLAMAKKNQLIRVLKREIRRLEGTNCVLEARCARLELVRRQQRKCLRGWIGAWQAARAALPVPLDRRGAWQAARGACGMKP